MVDDRCRFKFEVPPVPLTTSGWLPPAARAPVVALSPCPLQPLWVSETGSDESS